MRSREKRWGGLAAKQIPPRPGHAPALGLRVDILSGNSVVGIPGVGGAIYNLLLGTVTVSDSILSGNSVTRGGGAIFNFLGTLAVSNSLLFSNSAGGDRWRWNP